MSKPNLTFLIDDDEIFVFAMKRLIELKKLSKEVHHFATISEAIQYFDTHKKEPSLLPDIVLIDVNLGSETGWEFIDRYTQLSKELAKETNIYMLSASTADADIARATQHPHIKAYLNKPLSKDSLELIFGA
ncbi:MAG: response regulator [Sphingobacteriaceae bacterium]